jgi:hypothetical protein
MLHELRQLVQLVQSANSYSLVGAGSFITTQRYSDQQVPSNRKTHNSLKNPNPPNPRHLNSIISQNQFTNSIIPVPPASDESLSLD